jgi:uncharacterized Zn finger protein
MTEIECHGCGKVFTPHKCINTDNFDGEVRCPECKAFLRVKLVKGKLEKRTLIPMEKKMPPPLTADDYELIARLKEQDSK